MTFDSCFLKVKTLRHKNDLPGDGVVDLTESVLLLVPEENVGVPPVGPVGPVGTEANLHDI